MEFWNSLGQVSLLVLLIFLGIIFLFSLTVNLLSVPFLPTNKKRMKKMLEVADLKEDDLVFDLGSGDGRFVIEASKKVNYAVGFELNLFLNLWAWASAKIQKRTNVKFITQSFWQADLSKPTKVFVYLLGSIMTKMEDKFLNEAQDGLIIISNTFKFKNLKPIKEFPEDKIYVYKITKK